MPRRKKNHMRLVRLYLDAVRGDYFYTTFTDAKTVIDVPMPLKTLAEARRGYPWECWLAASIQNFANKNPKAFPHKVLFVYVIRSTIYIVSRKKNGQPSHAVRYFHDFGPLTKAFDQMSRAAFVKYINGDESVQVLRLRPAKTRKDAQHKDAERTEDRTGRKPGLGVCVSRGAMRRAIDAGLRPDVASTRAAI